MNWTKDILPHKARIGSRRERWQLIVLGLAAIYEGLVMVLSFGTLGTEIRGWLLFDVFEDD